MISVPQLSRDPSGKRVRAALVTGAAGAIGSEIARALARAGCRLILHDLRVDDIRSTTDCGPPADTFCIESDLTDLAATRRVISSALEATGGVDVLVNCAGIASDRRPLEELDDAYVELQMAINVYAAIALAQLAVPGMKQRKWGRLINISSENGTVGVANSSAYNAAKGALLALSKGWAREFGGWAITSNAVAPGLILTPMTKSYGEKILAEMASASTLGRPGLPLEIAATVAFLASDGAAFITGQVISPNGGSAIS